MKLDGLVEKIQYVDDAIRGEANKAVNRLLSMRNWLIGYYIVEYEQEGEDRAVYGVGLLSKLANKLNDI